MNGEKRAFWEEQEILAPTEKTHEEEEDGVEDEFEEAVDPEDPQAQFVSLCKKEFGIFYKACRTPKQGHTRSRAIAEDTS